MQPHFITCWGAESNQIWWVVCTHFEPLKLLIKWLWLRPVVSRTLHGWTKICKSSLWEWDNSDNFLNDEHLSNFYSEFSFYLVAELNSAAAVACCAWKPELNNKLKNIRILFIYLFIFGVLMVKDESSPDKGGHQSDDERWDTPPPKPPRIRR